VAISGTTFPTNGPAVGVFPTITTGSCSPSAPSLPIGEPALPICCNIITVINPAVTSGAAGVPFSQTFTQTGAIGTATFTLASGTLPAGLTLSTSGVLSGTPTVVGNFPITVLVTDSQGCTGIGPTYPLQITCPNIIVTNPAVTSGVAAAPFSQTFTESGGVGPTTFSIASGTLPAGLSLAANGTLSGTPTQTGRFSITVKATDSNGCTGTGTTYTLTITCQTITVTNPAVSNGVAGTPFSQTFTQSGGIGTTTFSLASGTLPTGLSLAANGTLSGTPTQTGSFAITVKATDSNGCSGTGATYSLTIACQTITVTNPAVSSGTVNSPFSQTFTQSGGIGATTFTLASGTLPAGLSLAANGTLSGTPTQTGSFAITVKATDSNGCSGTGPTYTLTIACQVITVVNPAVSTGVAGSPFSQTFTESNAVGTTTFTLASGALPTGISLAANGTLAGTPTVVGSFPITVTATDANGCTGTGTTYNLTITCQTITVTAPVVNTGVAGSPFSQTFTQSGAIGTATFSLAAGSLPSGMSLAANGTLSGTPTQTGTFPITVKVTDSNGCTGSVNYTLTIACPVITVTNPAVSSGVAGAPFSQAFSQTGAVGSATFSTASTLPAGLSLSAFGVLSGTPTQTGSFPVVVTVTDANGCTGTGPTYNLTITCQAIAVTNPSTNTGTAGTPFTASFTQSGAIGTATFTLASGSLPAGVTLAADGTLSGVPLQVGSFPITVTVTDSNGCTGTSAPTR
jgi:large repetitive protein